MTPFLNRDPTQSQPPWSEFEVQCYVVMMARRAGHLVHADSNGVKTSKSQAAKMKASGSHSGWPDLVFCLCDGRTVYIEMKVADGQLSKEQKIVHCTMNELGHAVHTVYASSPMQAWLMVQEIVDKAIGL